MAIYFVRHGETDWNREKRFQSTTDVPLNARGLAQAQCAADELKRRGVVFGVIICSPLSRAAVTAEIIGGALGLTPVVDKRLLEMRFGEWEGMLETELAAQFGDDFTRWRESHYTTAPPGGDSLSDVAGRLAPLLDELRSLQRNVFRSLQGNVLIVAHQAIMMALKTLLTNDYSVASAFSYKQNNDEVDVWELDPPRRVDFFRFDCDLSSL